MDLFSKKEIMSLFLCGVIVGVLGARVDWLLAVIKYFKKIKSDVSSSCER